jgi:hypothetical protein
VLRVCGSENFICSGILCFFVLGLTQNLIYFDEDWMLLMTFKLFSYLGSGVSLFFSLTLF